MNRRAMLGTLLFGGAAALTGGYVYLKDSPELVALFGEPTRLKGFIGGEKKAFVGNPAVVRVLARELYALDAQVAGSVEMVRERSLLSQSPDFLWPSSSVIVDIAKRSGLKVRRDQVVLNAPIVVYCWRDIAEGLARKGIVGRMPGGHFTIDLLAFLEAVVAGADWASLGVAGLYGRARITTTDPSKSNSGFMFSGLAANLFAGEVASMAAYRPVAGKVEALFRQMGYKSHSSGSLFDDYLAGGPGSQPMVVGYENQLVEWILADPERWKRVEAGRLHPVTLYPTPTVFSAHPLMAMTPAADGLIAAMTSPDILDIAWREHGFRGPLGAAGNRTSDAVAGLMPERIDAVLPMPEAEVMMAILDTLGSDRAPA